MGVIIDLKVKNKVSSARDYYFRTSVEAVAIINALVIEEGICLGELFTQIAINETCVEDMLQIIALAYKQQEDHDLLLKTGNELNDLTGLTLPVSIEDEAG